jgi:hypothetical protein
METYPDERIYIALFSDYKINDSENQAWYLSNRQMFLHMTKLFTHLFADKYSADLLAAT